MTTTPFAPLAIERDAPEPRIHHGNGAGPAVRPARSLPELTRVLRWGGGIVLAAAAVAFMCQGVHSLTPMSRHWIMLAICGLLGLLGVVTGTVLKEEKGARAFLGFAAASFPVLASQLGAMFFSLFGRPPAGMPQPLVFSFLTSARVAAVTGLTLAVIVPVSYLAFRVLARSRAGLLTGMFAAVNLLILMPVRESMWVAAIIAAAAGGLYRVDRTRLRSDFRLVNFEGRVARLLLFVPLGVMAGRTLFYPVSSVFYGVILALPSAYLAFYRGRVAKKGGVRNLCRFAGLAGLGTAWLTCSLPVLDSAAWGAGAKAYLILLPMAAILGAQSLAAGGSRGAVFRSAAAAVALLGVVVAHWVEPVSMVSLAGVFVATAMVAGGTLAGERPVFVLGLLAAALSLGNFSLQAVQWHTGYAWVALALLGIGVIFGASLIEKGLPRPFMKGGTLWGRLKAGSRRLQ
jgi:hypothetical protein